MNNEHKYLNTLIQECGDCPDILDGARAVLDLVSKIELSQKLSLKDESAKYWINRMAIDALEYVSNSNDNNSNIGGIKIVENAS